MKLLDAIADIPLQIREEPELRIFVWGDVLAVSVLRNPQSVDMFTGWTRAEIEELMGDVLLNNPPLI